MKLTPLANSSVTPLDTAPDGHLTSNSISDDSNTQTDIEYIKTKSYFPVHEFDECKSSDKAITIVEEGGTLSGIARWKDLDGSLKWKPCLAVAYDKNLHQFELEWEAGSTSMISRYLIYFPTLSESEETLRERENLGLKLSYISTANN